MLKDATVLLTLSQGTVTIHTTVLTCIQHIWVFVTKKQSLHIHNVKVHAHRPTELNRTGSKQRP